MLHRSCPRFPHYPFRRPSTSNHYPYPPTWVVWMAPGWLQTWICAWSSIKNAPGLQEINGAIIISCTHVHYYLLRAYNICETAHGHFDIPRDIFYTRAPSCTSSHIQITAIYRSSFNILLFLVCNDSHCLAIIYEPASTRFQQWYWYHFVCRPRQ